MDDQQIDGKELNEKNSKPLQDDYVKFIRWAQKRIETTNYGIVAFITNHAYIDNITFRGMRKSLMDTFDDIYVLDLHGNSSKKEKCPDGSKDENVFDIKQGVAISIFVKKSPAHSTTLVKYAELYGTREQKFESLKANSYDKISWIDVNPEAPNYMFKFTENNATEYNDYFSLADEIFLEKSACTLTGNDNDTITFDRDEMRTRIDSYFGELSNTEEGRNKFNKPQTKSGSGWSFDKAKLDVIKTGADDKYIVKFTYRPFDNRYTYFTGNAGGFHDRPRKMMRNLVNKDNLAIISVRQVAENVYNHVFISKNIADNRVMNTNKGLAYVFPLYIYGENSNGTKRNSNLNPSFLEKMEFILKLKFGVDFDYEEVLHYIYAIINSPLYRSRYIGFLKYDYPKIPITCNVRKFEYLCKLGKLLAEVHLMENGSVVLNISYPVTGNNIISKCMHKDDKLYINDIQYFNGVPLEIYNANIGGHQVVKKWLEARKGRTLKYNDIDYFKRMLNAIAFSFKIQQEIDETIGGFPMENFNKSILPIGIDIQEYHTKRDLSKF